MTLARCSALTVGLLATTAAGATEADLAAGEAEVLVVAGDRAMRGRWFDLAGEPLDRPALEFAKDAARPEVAWSDGTYLVAWWEGADLYARRFAPDGAALDAKPTQLTASLGLGHDVVATAEGFVVAWSQRDGGVWATELGADGVERARWQVSADEAPREVSVAVGRRGVAFAWVHGKAASGYRLAVRIGDAPAREVASDVVAARPDLVGSGRGVVVAWAASDCVHTAFVGRRGVKVATALDCGEDRELGHPVLARDDEGPLVAWERGKRPQAARLDRLGRVVGEPVAVDVGPTSPHPSRVARLEPHPDGTMLAFEKAHWIGGGLLSADLDATPWQRALNDPDHLLLPHGRVTAEQRQHLRGEGEYVHGRRVGRWVWTDDRTGGPSIEEHYDDEGRPHGTRRRWNEQGVLVAEEQWVAGEPSGTWRTSWPDGAPQSAIAWPEGPVSVWYPGGQLAEEGRNAAAGGTTLTGAWHPDGRPMTECLPVRQCTGETCPGGKAPAPSRPGGCLVAVGSPEPWSAAIATPDEGGPVAENVQVSFRCVEGEAQLGIRWTPTVLGATAQRVVLEGRGELLATESLPPEVSAVWIPATGLPVAGLRARVATEVAGRWVAEDARGIPARSCPAP